MDWHRLFGLILTDFFTDSPFVVELEKDLALKRQLLDVVILRCGSGTFSRRLPDGLDNLGAHNLITFKSHWDVLDDWALKELTGHYANYRKQCTPWGQALLPETDYRLLLYAADSSATSRTKWRWNRCDKASIAASAAPMRFASSWQVRCPRNRTTHSCTSSVHQLKRLSTVAATGRTLGSIDSRRDCQISGEDATKTFTEQGQGSSQELTAPPFTREAAAAQRGNRFARPRGSR